MEYIIDWVKNIIIIVLITTFMGLFLPDSDLRKYVRVVMGLFIISIFISPLSLILNGEIELNNKIMLPNKMELKWKEIKAEGEEIQNNNNQLIEEYYAEKINKKIKELLDIEFSDHKSRIFTTLENKYRIKRIDIYIYDNKGIKIVEIDSRQEEEKKNKKEISTDMEARIIKLKDKICSVLQTSPAIVNIKYHSGSDLIAIF